MLKMYEVKITFPFLAESEEDMLQHIRTYLYPHLDENIFDAPEIVREIPPDEAEQYEAVNQEDLI